MKRKGIFVVFTVFFLVGAVASIPYGLQIKWDVESVYAKNNNAHGDNNSNQGNNKNGVVPVPAPPTLVLIVIGLAVAGGYGVFRKLWK